MTKVLTTGTLIFMLVVTTFFVTDWFVNVVAERIAIQRGRIPDASDMAKIAAQETKDQESFQRLQAQAKEAIVNDAKRGARSTEIYVGTFNTPVINQLWFQLRQQGYKLELKDGLSEKETFLEIRW